MGKNGLKYRMVGDAIRKQILEGELQPKDKLPSEEEYARKYQVSTITVRKALSELAAEGHIVRIKSKGTFVSEPGGGEGASKLIALILSPEDYYDVSYMQIIKGAQKMAADSGYSLIVEWGDKSLDYEREIIRKMVERRVDGLLIYPLDPVRSRENYRLMEEASIPYVMIDRYDVNAPSHFVGCNNYEGGRLATRELLRLEHTKIKFAAYQFFLSSELERFDGYCSEMRSAGLPVTSENLLNGIDYDRLSAAIRRREVTALFCCNDKLAVKTIQALNARSIRVPQDVSVIGFDDWNAAGQLSVELATIRQDFFQLGELAANLLFNVIQGTISGKCVKMLTEATLIRRDSICRNPYAVSGAPPRAGSAW